MDTILTVALLRSIRIPRRVLETRGEFLSFRLQWKPTSVNSCGEFTKSEVMIKMIVGLVSFF